MKKIILCLLLLPIIWFSCQNAFADDKPTIVLGVRYDYRPFSFVDSMGAVQGFGVAFSQLLCKQMNVICQYQPMKFTELFQALKENKIDAALGGITISPEREKEFNFTIPYLPSPFSFVGLKKAGVPDQTQITPTLFNNAVIGVEVDSVYPKILLSKYTNVTIKTYPTSFDLIAALNDKKVDYVIMDTPAANYWVNQDFNVFYLVGSAINVNLYIGIMLNKNNVQLRDQLNAAIITVCKTEQFSDLLKTFFTGYNSKSEDLL